MDAVADPSLHTVVIMTSAQVGKTEILNNIVGFHIHHDPSPMLMVQPTLEMAQTWSKDRLSPMLRDTPALRDRVSETRQKRTGNTLLHKSFPGGHITMAGANSPASLASRPIRIVLLDEVDRYPASAGSEGDPVSLARKRSTTFWNRKIVLTSTPTVKGISRIEAEWDLSDQRRFHLPCPHCGAMQILSWANLVFDKEKLDGAHYACVNGCVIEEREKLWMLTNGEWIGELETEGRAGFHLNELYSPWKPWVDVARDFMEMKGSPETLKTFVNTSLGETWEEQNEGVDHTGLMGRRENYDATALPPDILVITAAVDVQKDRLEARSQGWGEALERWNIEKRIFWGDPAKPAVWAELDEWLKRTYEVDGRGMKIACTCVDTGGHHTEHVYNFCKPRQARRVFAVKGSSQYYAPIASKPSQVGRQRVMQYMIGTDTAKDSIVLSSLLLTEPGPGYIHFPHDMEDEEFMQLTAETRRTQFTRGQKKLKWVQTRDRNEELDLHVYNYAAYCILDPDTGAIKSRRKPKQPADEPALPRTTQRRRPARRRKNWATDI